MAGEKAHNLSLEERKEISLIFNEKYYELAQFSGVKYISYLILRLFQNLGVLGILQDKYLSCDEIIAQFKFSPKAKCALGWMLAFLSQNGLLKNSQTQDGKKYFYEQIEKIEPEVLLQKGMELDKNIAASTDLMNYVIDEYPNFLYGRKKGFEILFSGDKMALWSAYFSNENSGYKVYNYLGAFAAEKWAFRQNNIKLLEVGGGTGKAACALINRLKNKKLLPKLSEYIFSDVSPVFLRLGNRAIMNETPEDFCYSLKRLDFNKPLIEQGIKENDIDVVYGVNAIHVAKNLAASLKNIYQALKPGGMIIISEYCRPREDYLLFQEFIFYLLDNYVEVDLDSNLRPIPGFLDYEHWRRNLEAAGFKETEAVFNTDGNYALDLRGKVDIAAAAIKAEKPRG